MERLTYRLNDQCDNPTDSIILKPYLRYEDPETRKKILNRLAAYEETGLEPQDIISAVDMYKIACALHELNAYKDLGSIDHIRDLIKAEQDGRLVLMPCKVGDTVYRVLTTRDCPPVISEVKIKTVGQAADLIGRMGKRKLLSYYLTREEAEAAQKGGEGL